MSFYRTTCTFLLKNRCRSIERHTFSAGSACREVERAFSAGNACRSVERRGVPSQPDENNENDENGESDEDDEDENDANDEKNMHFPLVVHVML